MYFNSTYYEETMRCYNNLCHLADADNFVACLMNTYVAAKETNKNFVNIRAKCVRSKKRFMAQVKEKIKLSQYAFAVETMLQSFDSWSNLCLKNLTQIYKDNLEKVSKGDIHESNFN